MKDHITGVSVCLSDGSNSPVYGQTSSNNLETVEWKMPRDQEIRRVSIKHSEGKIIAMMFFGDEAGLHTLLNTA